jgi:threonine dehydrogenase-like Zn-dependent dehydrogenase
MKALIIDAPGSTSFADVPEPRLGDEDVLLRVRTAGFCGTDLSTFRGVNPLVEYPRIPGHELCCTIEEVGPAVPEPFRPGLNVVVHPYSSCGRCSACRRQRHNCCSANRTLGVQRDGGLSERLVVPWDKLYTSEKLSLREMALVEPLTVGYHAVMRGRVTRNDTVAVFGCGAIGLGVLAAAANLGARVIAIDIDEQKQALARKVGAPRISTPSCGDSPTARAPTLPSRQSASPRLSVLPSRRRAMPAGWST